jgi:hypothetical protein
MNALKYSLAIVRFKADLKISISGTLQCLHRPSLWTQSKVSETMILSATSTLLIVPEDFYVIRYLFLLESCDSNYTDTQS